MGKINYVPEYNEPQCEKCNSKDFFWDWEDSILKCKDCYYEYLPGEENLKPKPKEKLKKFKERYE